MAFGPTHLVHTDEAALAKATASGDKTGSMEPGSRSSAGERLLHTQDVTGSIPVATTTPFAGVYFIRARATRRVKIGFSIRVAKRLIDIQNQCADRLDLLAIIPSDDARFLEGGLHNLFRRLRCHGEWHSTGAKLTAFLDSLRNPPDPDEDEDPFELFRHSAWVYDRLSLLSMVGGRGEQANLAACTAMLLTGTFVPVKLPTPRILSPFEEWRAEAKAIEAARPPMTTAERFELAERLCPANRYARRAVSAQPLRER